MPIQPCTLLSCEFFSALIAAALQDLAAVQRSHTLTKTMHLAAVPLFGLESSLHDPLPRKSIIRCFFSKVREPLFFDKKTILLYRKTAWLSTKNRLFAESSIYYTCFLQIFNALVPVRPKTLRGISFHAPPSGTEAPGGEFCGKRTGSYPQLWIT